MRMASGAFWKQQAQIFGRVSVAGIVTIARCHGAPRERDCHRLVSQSISDYAFSLHLTSRAISHRLVHGQFHGCDGYRCRRWWATESAPHPSTQTISRPSADGANPAATRPDSGGFASSRNKERYAGCNHAPRRGGRLRRVIHLRGRMTSRRNGRPRKRCS